MKNYLTKKFDYDYDIPCKGGIFIKRYKCKANFHTLTKEIIITNKYDC